MISPIVVALIALLALAACGNGSGDAAQRSKPARAPLTLIEGRSPVVDTSSTPKDSFWVGRSGGYSIEWTWRDIVASNAAGARFLSVRAVLDSVNAGVGTPIDTGEVSEPSYGVCDLEYDVEILSIVGPIVSLKQLQYLSCRGAAHPSLVNSYITLDLARIEREGISPVDGAGVLGQDISLTDLFPDEHVLEALLGDRLVQKRIEEIRGKTIRPRTSAELVGLLEGGSECEYTFDDDMLRRFAFHHVEGDRVAVRIGLSHGCEAARGKLTQIGILLPIPAKLRVALEAASRGTEGVLMREASKTFGSAVTHIGYRYRIDENDEGAE